MLFSVRKMSRSVLALAVVAACQTTSAQASYTFDFTPANAPDQNANGVYLNAINNKGDLAGQFSADGANYYGFSNQTQFTGPKPNGSNVYVTTINGINNNGQLSGTYSLNGNSPIGFYSSSSSYAAGTTQIINDTNLNGGTSQQTVNVMGLNDNGLVVGYHLVRGAALSEYSFIYNSANQSYSEILPAGVTTGKVEANAINNSGLVTGDYIANSSTPAVGFLYSASTGWTTFSDPNAGSLGTYPLGINNNGDVVGYYGDASGSFHGFIYDAVAHTFINASLDAPGVGIISTQLFGINDQGVLVGQVSAGLNPYTNFVATPAAAVPVPGAFWMMSSVLVGVCLRRRMA